MNEKKTIIFGITKYAEVIRYLCQEVDNQMVVCHTAEREYISDIRNFNMTIVPFEEIEKYYPSDKYKILPVVGYKNMNNGRKIVFDKILTKGYEIASFIHPSAYIAKNVKMGIGNIITENVTIAPFSNIGDGNIFNSNTNIAHHTQIDNFNFFAQSPSIAGSVHITHNCFFGCNCTIRNGVTVMPYTLVGAGAYVSANTQEYSVIVPAKSIVLNDKQSIDIDLG
jgi:sugar O-acyltransferase (sialic acid O-acetyltransferase NeuD family)